MQGSTKLFYTALHTLPMMTAESMLSKRLVLTFTVASLFLLNQITVFAEFKQLILGTRSQKSHFCQVRIADRNFFCADR